MTCNEICNHFREVIGKFNQSMNEKFPDIDLTQEQWEDQLVAWLTTYLDEAEKVNNAS